MTIDVGVVVVKNKIIITRDVLCCPRVWQIEAHFKYVKDT
jgi:hypothetical protein